MALVDRLPAFRAAFVGRTDAYAVQQEGGSYVACRAPLTDAVLLAHLAGEHTIATYLGERDLAHHLGLDFDGATGKIELRLFYHWLLREGVSAILEDSSRGGHLWVSLAEPVPAAVGRRALRGLALAAGLPLDDQQGRELYPKADVLPENGLGNCLRLPLGIHRKTGRRYPFLRPGRLTPVAKTLGEHLEYVSRGAPTPPERIVALAEDYPLPEPERPPVRERTPRSGDEALPGDDFNARATWEEILEPLGWRFEYRRGEVCHWRRPGKRDGTSATTGFGQGDLLHVFTTSSEFEVGQSYSKFAAFAHLHHRGDFRAAAQALREQGYGSRRAA